MKKILIALLCFLLVVKIYGQSATRSYGTIVLEITKEKRQKRISAKLESMSTFPGGDSAWGRALEDTLNRSIRLKNRVKAGRYIVSVRFLVEKDGSLADIACVNDAGVEICEQVRPVVKKMMFRTLQDGFLAG